MNLLYAGLFFILVSAVQGQSIHELFGTDKFHRAFFEARSNQITFEPFQELNWDAKARTALSWLNLDRPTPSQIARLSTLESAGPQFRSIDFRAPVDPIVSGATYFLVAASAVTPLQPVQLKGSVNFDFDRNMTAVQRRVIFGTVVGKPISRVTTAAFVFASKAADVADVHPGAKFERRKQAGATVYDFIDAGRTVTWTIPSREQPDAASALSFRLNDQHLVLVKWRTDFCGSAYTLFSVDTALKPIAGNDYDCDP